MDQFAKQLEQNRAQYQSITHASLDLGPGHYNRLVRLQLIKSVAFAQVYADVLNNRVPFDEYTRYRETLRTIETGIWSGSFTGYDIARLDEILNWMDDQLPKLDLQKDSLDRMQTTSL